MQVIKDALPPGGVQLADPHFFYNSSGVDYYRIGNDSQIEHRVRPKCRIRVRFRSWNAGILGIVFRHLDGIPANPQNAPIGCSPQLLRYCRPVLVIRLAMRSNRRECNQERALRARKRKVDGAQRVVECGCG